MSFEINIIRFQQHIPEPNGLKVIKQQCLEEFSNRRAILLQNWAEIVPILHYEFDSGQYQFPRDMISKVFILRLSVIVDSDRWLSLVAQGQGHW